MDLQGGYWCLRGKINGLKSGTSCTMIGINPGIHLVTMTTQMPGFQLTYMYRIILDERIIHWLFDLN